MKLQQAILALVCYLTLAGSCHCWYVEVPTHKAIPHIQDHNLVLVIFGNKDKHDEKIKQYGVEESIKLLGQDKNIVKVFMIDAEKEPKLVERYKLAAFPEIRMFWKGIPLLPPALPKITATTLYRWIKQQIRATGIINLRETDATTFFENLKEKHPFIVVGLGPKDTLEAKFLNEFSRNPRNTFAMYLIQDKLAKNVFQSIGLSSSQFNVILINNLGKKIKEYTGDLDYVAFWDFLMEQTKALGATSITNRENFIKDIASTGNPFALLTLSEKSNRDLESGFIKKARTLSNEFNINVLYGVNSPKLHEAFEIK